MAGRFQDKEGKMKCNNCGSDLEKIITNLPFKINLNSIIIIKDLPVLQCQNCNEYFIEDPIMEKVDYILDRTDKSVELEILNYAV
jgi:YgiT-type zinc finger domain-containing protein